VNRKRCIVCNRPVPRRTTTYWFREPRAAIEAGPFGGSIPAHPEGEIIGTEIFTANPPTDRVGCQRYTNHTIISHKMDWRDKSKVSRFTVWDGESYLFRGHFCTNNCVMSQGYASAQFGERFIWKDRT
jgi:hypothetical protein